MYPCSRGSGRLLHNGDVPAAFHQPLRQRQPGDASTADHRPHAAAPRVTASSSGRRDSCGSGRRLFSLHVEATRSAALRLDIRSVALVVAAAAVLVLAVLGSAVGGSWELEERNFGIGAPVRPDLTPVPARR